MIKREKRIKKNSLNVVVLFLVFVLSVFIVFLIFQFNYTGRVTLDLPKTSYNVGDIVGGDLNLVLKQGELIPANVDVVTQYGDLKKSFPLSSFLKDEKQGDYFVKGVILLGSGNGYGFEGEQIADVNFKLEVYDLEDNSKATSNNETSNNETSNNETSNNVNPKVSANGLQDSSGIVVSNVRVTGASVSNFIYEINGNVRKGKDFRYSVGKNKKIVLVEDSVKVADKIIGDSSVSVVLKDGVVTVSTNYVEKGFGVDYFSKNEKTLNLDLSKFGFVSVNGTKKLIVSLVYKNNSLIRLDKNIVAGNIVSSEINKVFLNDSNFSVDVDVKQLDAVLGKSVKWKKKVKMSKPVKSVHVGIPDDAVNVKIVNVKKLKSSEDFVDSVIVKDNGKDDVKVVINSVGDNLLNKNEVVVESKLSLSPIIKSKTKLMNFFKNILSLSGFVISNQGNNVELNPNETVKEIEIEYETPAPYSEEIEIDNGKRVKIVGPDNIHYQNVLAFTNLSESLDIKDINEIKIYWEEDNSYVPVLSLKDKNNNGIYDYVEWIAPHLSNQTFDIIKITKAEHLDSNRNFISDIYGDVKELDGNWSETVNDSEYVRVTFERNLTEKNDITIYPRTILGNPKIEVYEFNQSAKIAEFSSLKDNEYNKIYLDGSSGVGLGNKTQDVFDLLIKGGSVEFDYIVDPAGDTNVWIASTPKLFSDANAWSLGSIPVAGEFVVLNGSGTGNMNITNNTMPQDLGSFTVDSGYTGTVNFEPLFAVGSWGNNAVGSQEWNVTNNINISGGTMKIYGAGSNYAGVMKNKTIDGEGQVWHSLSGNISIGSLGVLDGEGLGFLNATGPGAGGGNAKGGVHGSNANYGVITKAPFLYGNASAPTSLGSGGGCSGGHCGYNGGSAIKLDASNIKVDGNITMDGVDGVWAQGAGGSIWLKADSIIGVGILSASTQLANDGRGGGAGRIRLEYGSSMDYTGLIDLNKGGTNGGDNNYGMGSLTFTNNIWPGDWNLNGDVGLLGGNYGEGNVLNVLGNFNSNNYNFSVYGDCYGNASMPEFCYNTTANGQGLIINASGNITISSESVIYGINLGFPSAIGPGHHTWGGASHGGKSLQVSTTYGNEIGPTSLGSGTSSSGGSSAIKLESAENVYIYGDLKFESRNTDRQGSPGSIWLKGNNIYMNGSLNANGYDRPGGVSGGAGGGRIALTANNLVDINGEIDVNGAKDLGLNSNAHGYGGTIFINASNSITIGGNLTSEGYSGGTINVTDTLINLGGDFNTSYYNSSLSNVIKGVITLNYTDCSSLFDGYFNPNPLIYTSCDVHPVTTLSYPSDNSILTSPVTFEVNATDDYQLANATFYLWNSTSLVNFSTNVITGTSNSTTFVQGFSYNDSYIWNVKVEDNSSNIDWGINRTFNVDFNSPLVSIVYPENVSYSDTVSSLNYTVSDSYLDSCWYSLDKGVTNISVVCGDNITGVISSNGGNQWFVWANDSNNYVGGANVSFNVNDIVNPLVMINFPENRTYGNSSLPLTFDVSLDVVGSVWYNLNGGNNISMTGENGVTGTHFSATNSSIADGGYTFNVFANDTAGNNNFTESINFSFDSSLIECNDGIDNDGDGLVDWQYDLGCYGPNDLGEVALPRDSENGWTTIDPSSDSLIVYVSDSTGNDSWSGLAPEWNGTDGPKKTILNASNLLRDGYPDWMLLKRGDVWKDQGLDSGIGRWDKSGRNDKERAVIGSYGNSIIRPKLELSDQRSLTVWSETNLLIEGIDFYFYKMDPSNPEFSGFTKNGIGISYYSENVTFEGNRIRYSGIVVQSGDGKNFSNVQIRRNVIEHSYSIKSHSQSIFTNTQWPGYLLIEDNVMYHGGWSDDFRLDMYGANNDSNSWKVITNGAFNISLGTGTDKGDTYTVTGLDFSGVQNMNDIASIINNSINTVTSPKSVDFSWTQGQVFVLKSQDFVDSDNYYKIMPLDFGSVIFSGVKTSSSVGWWKGIPSTTDINVWKTFDNSGFAMVISDGIYGTFKGDYFYPEGLNFSLITNMGDVASVIQTGINDEMLNKKGVSNWVIVTWDGQNITIQAKDAASRIISFYKNTFWQFSVSGPQVVGNPGLGFGLQGSPGSTIYNRNMYLSHGYGNTVVRGNVDVDGSSGGTQLREGGLLEDNLYLRDPFAISIGHAGNDEYNVSGEIKNNVILGTRDISTQPQGTGISVGSYGPHFNAYQQKDGFPSYIIGVNISGNIVAHATFGTFNVKGLSISGTGIHTDLDVHDNIVYNWSRNWTSIDHRANGFALNANESSVNVSFRNNLIQQVGGGFVGNSKDNVRGINISNNTYFSTEDGLSRDYRYGWFVLGSTVNISTWFDRTNDTSIIGKVKFSDPSRNINTYMASLGETPTLDAFIEKALNQSRFNWNPNYTSYVVNQYIRDGFVNLGMEGDSVNPVVTLSSPNNGLNTSSNSQSFGASFTDNVKLTNTTFYLWNSTGDVINTTIRLLTGTSDTISLSVTLPYEDRFVWNYKAYDNSSNNAFASSNYEVTYDKTSPTGNYVYPTNDSGVTVNNNYIEVNVSASDSLSGVENILVRLYNSTNDLINSSSNSYVNFSDLSNGLYYYNVSVIDYSGNVADLLTRNITVASGDLESPNVLIKSPRNRTYNNHTSIHLSYRVSDSNLDSVWYKVINRFGGVIISNTTLVKNTTFVMPLTGINFTLFVFANDTSGNLNSTNVTFDVSNRKRFVRYEDFYNKGETTDLDELDENQLSNLSGFVLENPGHGKIIFLDNVNLTDTSSGNNVTDLDDWVNISFNKVEINSTLIPGLNVPANLTLTNLTFGNPKILRDGIECSQSVCTKLSYSNGVLIFEVNQFSVYSSEETVASPSGDSGNNGGGGGGARASSGGSGVGTDNGATDNNDNVRSHSGGGSSIKDENKTDLSEENSSIINVSSSYWNFGRTIYYLSVGIILVLILLLIKVIFRNSKNDLKKDKSNFSKSSLNVKLQNKLS